MTSERDPVTTFDETSAGDGAEAEAGAAPRGETATAEPAAPTEPGTATELAAPTEPGTATDPPVTAEGPATGPATDRAADGRPAGEPGPDGATTDDDAWSAFGPPAPGRRGPVRRIGGGLRRMLWHEWTVVSLLGVLVSVAMTWPAALHPSTTIPEDLGDPTLVAWELAWSGHAAPHGLHALWTTNTFWPDRYSFAFTDTLLGYLPVNLIGHGFVAALIRYNLVFIFAFALASVGAYALVRQLGAGRVGAAVAGIAFAYAPWRYGQSGHLHVMSSGGTVLALAMLARGHGWSLRDGYRRDRVRPGWIIAGWLVAAWQITIGFGIGLVFGYILGGIAAVGLVLLVLRRWRLPRAALVLDLVGGLVFGVVTVLMALPYLHVQAIYPNVQRTMGDLKLYSPPLRGFLISPPESWLWGTLHSNVRATLAFPPEMALLPGFTLIGLALAGLFVSVWTVRVRVVLAVAALVTLDLAVGTNGPLHGWLGYTALYQLPGINALRTPGRLGEWLTLLLGILAAGALTGLTRREVEVRGDRVPSRRDTLLHLAMLIPLAMVVVEGVNKMPHPIVPPPPAGLSSVAAPLVVLPNDGIDDELYMLWTTDGFPAMVNGISGYQSPFNATLKAAAANFPDPAAVDQLRSAGVRSIVVLRDATDNQAQLDAPVDQLGITRQERGDMIVYSLNP